jgi:DnaA-like protein
MSLGHAASSSCPALPGRSPPEGAWPAEATDSRNGDPPLAADLPAAAQVVIEHVVSQVFGVTHNDLSIKSRGKAHVALARQVAMYLTHVALQLTFTEVGLLFGRDRTTVAHACKLVEDRRDDPAFDRALDLLEWALPSLLRSGWHFTEGMV